MADRFDRPFHVSAVGSVMSCEHKNIVKLSMYHSDCFLATFPDGSQYEGYAEYDGTYGKTTNVHICLDCGQLVGGIDLDKLRAFAEHQMSVSQTKKLIHDILHSHINWNRIGLVYGQEWYPPEGLDEPEHKDDLEFVQDMQSVVDDDYFPTSEEIQRLEAIQSRVASFYQES